ncbi:unnamed protein product [Adineta steineri]|uniref:Uncharacterized protein n=1 Tax=Adineta steineri TaxID=433720 RepID=A0A813VD87_9BILA|nr:unnamed protein product [Adineta steineri]CAF0836042.1 unnamed protein product [Adineta steineri]CAF0888628.1 unnamed protein product [Adineta steineri]CAF0942201.1 unnamed protein product [Adineta steineri]CAF0975895.1 unnamed protein product [Adineta steineri]
MRSEKIPLTGSHVDAGFYTGREISTGDAGTSGISRRILHGLTIISVLIACGCSIYGSFQAETPFMILPFLVVLIWIFIHFLLLFFARREHHEFNPPAWFIFVSSGHIFIQSLIVIILTLFKKQ